MKTVNFIKRLKDRKVLLSFDNLRVGSKVKIFCSHKNCVNKIFLKVLYPSTMECITQEGQYIDLRNQIWFCKNHVKLKQH
jgi:hypothetical protein